MGGKTRAGGRARPQDLWVFGYGSLLWRPDFAYTDSVVGAIHGFARRFWQASPDHRGTPQSPGRVVTLIESAGADCVGIAYRVASGHVAQVLARLDVREQAGYEQRVLAFSDRSGSGHAPARVLVYIAGRHNPNFRPQASIAQVADIVRIATGPSGPNRDYVYQLQRALAGLGVVEPHIEALISHL